MPAPQRRSARDLADAPRRAFVVTLQLAVLLLVGVPLVAATQPFLPPFQGAAVLVLVLAALSIAFWRNATNLQEHARAGAQAIVEVLANQAQSGDAGEAELAPPARSAARARRSVPLRLAPAHYAVGKTLAEINLRGLTGATVLACVRDGKGVLVPTGKEALRPGDVLALAGTHAAIDAARALLTDGPAPPAADDDGPASA